MSPFPVYQVPYRDSVVLTTPLVSAEDLRKAGLLFNSRFFVMAGEHPRPHLATTSVVRTFTAGEQGALLRSLEGLDPELEEDLLLELARNQNLSECAFSHLLSCAPPEVLAILCANPSLTPERFLRLAAVTVLTGCDDQCAGTCEGVDHYDHLPSPRYASLVTHPVLESLTSAQQVLLTSMPCYALRVDLAAADLGPEALTALLDQDHLLIDLLLVENPGLDQRGQDTLLARGADRLRALAVSPVVTAHTAHLLAALRDPEVLEDLSSNPYVTPFGALQLPPLWNYPRLEEFELYLDGLDLDPATLAALRPDWSGTLDELVSAVRSFSPAANPPTANGPTVRG